ncbi:MAG: DNA polymerase III subunit alpha [Candidatus Dormibacteria bacterium]
MSGYVELHAHSSYSFLDGASSPDELAECAARLGHTALALTDHDGLYGAVKHWNACRRHHLHPVFGAEMTLDDSSHLVLLAENRAGWQSLCRLISRAQLAEAKASARLRREWLDRDSTRGLIALTGCRSGAVARSLLAGDQDAATAALAALRDAFGKNAVFVELQAHHLPDDGWLNAELAALAARAGLPLMATGNVHYATAEGRPLQDALVAIRHRSSLDDAERAGWLRPNGEYRLRTADEARAMFRDWPEAVAGTTAIAERCQVELDRSHRRFPGFRVPEDETPFSHLYKLCHEGAVQRYRPLTSEVLSRLAHELRVIEKLNLAEFFLINWDLMRHAREQRIPGQGRGSAADSVVAYVLGITRVDPIAHNLLFERFLHEDMTSTPDIDIDFSTEHREQVIQYVYSTYGWERTGMVCNVVTFRPRMAVRQVGKALGFPAEVLDRVAKSCDGWYSESIRETIDVAGYRGALGSLPWDTLIGLCEQLCGHPRHLSIHVGGMLVTGEPLVDMVPVERATMPGRVVVQFNKDDVEDLGLIKMDLLGLRTLSVVAETLDMIEDATGARPDLDALTLDDPKVYDLCCEADTIGVFQVESRAQMATLPRTRPRAFNDLVVEVAIIRPGPIQGNAVNPYIRRRQGREPVTYLDPRLEPILQDTMGVILYQEQILEISMRLAGFSAGESDRFRRAMNRHRSRAEMEAVREAFVSGCVNTGVAEAVADELFHGVAGFAQYGFTKSHAAAFARTVYETAWLKLNHPAEFCAGILNNQPMGFYHPSVVLEDARRRGVEIRGVDVNASRSRCRVEAGALRLGFNYVRGIGSAWLEVLDQAREAGPYRDPEDFVRRTGLSRRAVNDLVMIGAFDSLGAERRALLWRDPGAVDHEAMIDPEPPAVEFTPMSDEERTAFDYRVLKLSTERHVISFYREQMEQMGVSDTRAIWDRSEGESVRIAGLVITRQAPMTAKGLRFFTLEDEFGQVNAVIYPDVYQRCRNEANRNPVLVIEGRVQRADGVISVRASDVRSLRLRGPLPLLGTRY